MGYGFFVLLLFFHLLITSSSGKSSGVCISQGGRFPLFASEGKPPKKVSRGSKDLTLCRVFRQKTCCDAAQTHPAFLSIRRLASTGEASSDCLHLWELLECSICDPLVGVQPGPPLMCSSFCDRVFDACANAYLSMDAKTQNVVDSAKNDYSKGFCQACLINFVISSCFRVCKVLSPCGVNDFICGRASEWVSNGTELCRAAGFAVKISDYQYSDVEETSCYGGKSSLESISGSWRASQSEVPQKSEKLGVLEDFQQRVQKMTVSVRVSWAVGGMVLTAGLLFLSKRRSRSQRQKLAAIQRNARRLEVKMNQRSPDLRGSRIGSRR